MPGRSSWSCSRPKTAPDSKVNMCIRSWRPTMPSISGPRSTVAISSAVTPLVSGTASSLLILRTFGTSRTRCPATRTPRPLAAYAAVDRVALGCEGARTDDSDAPHGLVGCTPPIQQAPMGTVSSPRLAVAVAKAGGIGSINTLAMTRETLRRRLDEMREQTDGVLAVSFLTNDIDVDAVADGAARGSSTSSGAILGLISSRSPTGVERWSTGRLDRCRRRSRRFEPALTSSALRVSRPAGTAAAIARCCRCSAKCSMPWTCLSLPPAASPMLAASLPRSLRGHRVCGWALDSSPRTNRRRMRTTRPRSSQRAPAARGEPTPSATVRCPRRHRARVLVSAIDAVEAIDVDVVGTLQGIDGELPVPRRSWVPPTDDVSGHVDAMAMYAGESVVLVNDIVPAGQLVRSLAEGAEALLGQARLS